MAMLNNQMLIPHNIPIWRRCDLTATMLNKFWSLWDPTFAPFPMIDQECCKIEFRPIRCQSLARCFVSGMMSLQKLPHELWYCSSSA